MRSKAIVLLPAVLLGVLACQGPEPGPRRLSASIICTATVLDSSGAVVVSVEDTVPVTIQSTGTGDRSGTDSVTTDPRPCRTTLTTSGYMVLNAKDSVSGDPRPH